MHWGSWRHSLNIVQSFGNSFIAEPYWPTIKYVATRTLIFSLAWLRSVCCFLTLNNVCSYFDSGRAKWHCVLEQGTSPYFPLGKCPCTYCKSLWIRASAKWIHVNVNVIFSKYSLETWRHICAWKKMQGHTVALTRLWQGVCFHRTPLWLSAVYDKFPARSAHSH